MKKALIPILIFFYTVCSAQNFTGDYRSYKTSFQDFPSTKNNFIEETEFRIAVLIDENQVEGSIIIQDPRIPDKLLIYKIIDYLGVLKDDGKTNYLYKCLTEHLDNPVETTIVFYYKIDEKLSLMVYNEKSSQVFFDLELQ
ncbi:MAG TPA: hypothetical protein VIO43_09090 [Lutibacter sp.]